LQNWVNSREITKLDVVIEMPFLKSQTGSDTRGVTTLMTQMRMIDAYEQALFELENCEVRLGTVSNSTAKSIFTNNGNASKIMMVTFSAWNRRPDVKVREHLADAQGIGTCHPVMFPVANNMQEIGSLYEDDAIGVGPAWKGKL